MGGRTWFPLYACVSVSKSERHGSFFGSEKSENISRKMGVKFSVSLNMSKNL